MRLFSVVCLAVLGAVTLPADSVYIALGDSITFGETDLNYVPSLGDRGFVSKFADTLASRNGGVRPSVINLAIDGETSTSFVTGFGRTPPVVGRTDALLAAQNLNYAGNPATPQAVMFSNAVAAEAMAGNTVSDISISLGFNELAALTTLPTSQALALLPSTLADYQANYTAVLTQIRSLEPLSDLYILGYYNPFVADPTANPAKPVFAAGGAELNAVIQGLATEFNASYVDTNTPFLGHEGALTYITQYPSGATSPGNDPGIEPIGNVHPNDAGYAVIANQLADVPEPASFGLVGIAVGLSIAWKLRRNQI